MELSEYWKTREEPRCYGCGEPILSGDDWVMLNGDGWCLNCYRKTYAFCYRTAVGSMRSPRVCPSNAIKLSRFG